VRGSWVVVAPLRVGGGTRLKILEAMALGTPLISTHKGAEGLAVQSDKHLLLADKPHEIADAISRLFEDENLRQELSQAGRALVVGQYDWSMIGQQFIGLINDVAQA
jgi:polysaccharide biosynthesis protein PslH